VGGVVLGNVWYYNSFPNPGPLDAMYSHNTGYSYRMVDPYAARARSVSPAARSVSPGMGMQPLAAPRYSMQYPAMVSPYASPRNYHPHAGSHPGRARPSLPACPLLSVACQTRAV
jgi:hypothetical protein